MLTSAIILSALAVILSLVAKYIPSLARWYYDPARDDVRGLIMVGLMAAITAGYCFLAPQFGWQVITWQQALIEFFFALGSNQLTDRVTADSSTQKQMKEERTVG